ncbi:MAG: hypothetical protein DYH12_07455 [Sorangiineae bacterium PRO1]|nr:hypothetical protein [Sorangiineae bacterium PRO1]
MRWLSLAPADSGFQLEFHFADVQMLPISKETKFAFGVLSKDDIHSSEDIYNEYDWDRYDLAERPSFFGVRPKDEERQWAAVQKILCEAQRCNADILLLPELSLSEQLFTKLQQEPAFQQIPLLVPGSCHVATGGKRNITTAFAKGKALGSHCKFSPVDLADRDKERREDLEISRIIKVLYNERFSFVMVICKDIIEDRTRQLLKQLDVHLVLVPAMSPTTKDFEDFSRDFGSICQGYTAIANIGPNQAVLGGPWATNSPKVFNYKRLGVLILDSDGMETDMILI